MKPQKPKHHLILTVRRGRGKHEWSVGNRPLVTYPMSTMSDVDASTKTVWTDCPTVSKYAEDYELEVRERPESTCSDTSPHIEIIRHAVLSVARPDDIVTVLLGNTVYVTPELIEESYKTLLEHPDKTGVLSCWEAADDHPFRALIPDADGNLQSYLSLEAKGGATSNRQSYPRVLYYDQGVWTFRARYADEGGGPHPWTWCGPRTLPLVRPWVTGRDIHDEMDLSFSGHWLNVHRND